MKKFKQRRLRRWTGLAAVLLILVAYTAWSLLKPLPPLKPAFNPSRLQFSTPAATLSWPSVGQSAIGIVGSDTLDTHNTQKPMPTASVAKIITALTVLSSKPLEFGQPGPTITLGTNDLNLYQTYVAQGGSVVPVAGGEQISQYQVLETMLLPSANNMADSLATWAFGSLPAYRVAATNFLKQHGINNTTVGTDASGFSPTTTSTAQDLVKLGELAIQNPVIAQIVGQSTASNIPLTGTIKNVNALLGTDGIIGIKTGNTDQAGGVYLAAARTTVNQKSVTIVTALMDAPSLFQSMKYSLPMVESAGANFKPVTVVHAGDIMTAYPQPDGSRLPVVAAKDLTITTWNGITLYSKFSLPTLPRDSQHKSAIVGTLTITDPSTGTKMSAPLKLGADPAKPTLWQRLRHPS